ncbi:MAG TPA: rhodanese-like domain-containing protein, partial [Candidimonas sp.]|nr:rhodanese-like domain-containing protein [Candidimonas sp.]
PAWLSVGGASDTVVTVPVSAGEQVAAGQAAMPTVDVQAVLSNIKSPAFTVVDARAANRYRGEIEPMDPVAGHIPGALNRPSLLNVQEDGRFKPVAQLRSEFETLLQGVSAQNVVHQCGSGISACHNLFAMELAGLSGSAVYPGSWSEWCSDPSRPVARG